MASVRLWSTEQGKQVPFKLSVDVAGDVLARNGDETLKFPGGLSKEELKELFDQHNTENDGKQVVDEDEATEAQQRIDDTRAVLDEFDDEE